MPAIPRDVLLLPENEFQFLCSERLTPIFIVTSTLGRALLALVLDSIGL